MAVPRGFPNLVTSASQTHHYTSFTSEATILAKKVIYYVSYVFAGFAQVVVTIVGGIPKLTCQKISENFFPNRPANHTYALKRKINQAQLKQLQTALRKFSSEHGNEIEIKLEKGEASQSLESREKKHAKLKFIQLLNDIIDIINRSDSIDSNIQAEDVLEKLDEIIQSKFYTTLQESNPNHPILLLLQNLAFAGMTADGSTALREYGRNITDIPREKTDFSFAECATIMDKILSAPFSSHRNNPISDIFWGICNPLRAWHAWGSSMTPTEFNAHYGNSYFVDSKFINPNPHSPDRTTASRIIGPTPTNKGLYRAYLSHLQRNELMESRIGQQGPIKRSENERHTKLYEEYADFRNSGTLDFSIFSFDAPIMKTPSGYINTQNTLTATDFIAEYKEFITKNDNHRRTSSKQTDDNGFNISEKGLSDDRIDDAFKTASDCFEKISINNPFWTQLSTTTKGKERLCRMMQLGTQAIMRVDMIYQGLNNSDGPKLGIVSEACKQDVDRGPVLNVATTLFFRLLSNSDPLTKDEMHSIIGTAVGRAMMVDDRLILWERYEVLSDLLHFIGDSNNVAILAGSLKEFLEFPTEVAQSAAGGVV